MLLRRGRGIGGVFLLLYEGGLYAPLDCLLVLYEQREANDGAAVTPVAHDGTLLYVYACIHNRIT